MSKVAEAFQKVKDEGAAKKSQEVRQIKSIAVGKAVRQGDVYCIAVDASHPKGEVTANRQLAIGNTQGSRHIVSENPSVKIFIGVKAPEWCDAQTFLGPVIVATERFVVEHPEHAHVSLPPGCFQILHQKDWRTMERVRD